MSFSVSAPGKVILFGEIAVVYGYPAVCASLDLYCSFNVDNDPVQKSDELSFYKIFFSDITESHILLKKSDFGNIVADQMSVERILPLVLTASQNVLEGTEMHMLSSLKNSLAVCILLEVLIHQLYPLSKKSCPLNLYESSKIIRIVSELPISSGLGSSAAFCCSASTTLLLLHNCLSLKDSWTGNDLDKINALAFEAEKIMHGSPSGIDTAISVSGGFILFQKDASNSKAITLKSLISIKSSSVCNIFIINTGITRSTANVINDIILMRSLKTDLTDSIFKKIGVISQTAAEFIPFIFSTENDALKARQKLSHLMDDNQKLLSDLNVSHSVIDSIVSILSAKNISSKLTGAGKGGCIIAMQWDREGNLLDPRIIQEHIKQHTLKFIKTVIGGTGVKVQPIFPSRQFQLI